MVHNYKLTKAEAVEAWHFPHNDLKLRYGDGTTIAPGYIYHWDGIIQLCWGGLHACKRIRDARNYVYLPQYVCKVKVWGEIEEDTPNWAAPKLSAEYREVLWIGKFNSMTCCSTIYANEKSLKTACSKIWRSGCKPKGF